METFLETLREHDSFLFQNAETCSKSCVSRIHFWSSHFIRRKVCSFFIYGYFVGSHLPFSFFFWAKNHTDWYISRHVDRVDNSLTTVGVLYDIIADKQSFPSNNSDEITK